VVFSNNTFLFSKHLVQ